MYLHLYLFSFMKKYVTDEKFSILLTLVAELATRAIGAPSVVL